VKKFPLINTLLAAFYFLIITPVGLCARMVRDPLERSLNPRSSTYWYYSPGSLHESLFSAGRKLGDLGCLELGVVLVVPSGAGATRYDKSNRKRAESAFRMESK
jgi:hypothetical protein